MSTVFVALSGGVDSAVAAHMLQAQGHTVSGVFIRVWQPDFLSCSQDDEERAAKRVAAHLGIPFYRCDLRAEYKRDVVDTMIAEYRAGRTPNPDVLCNAHIKFGAFLKWARTHGAEHIATGHHARVINGQLYRGVDSAKDQAYFLWKLTKDELAHTFMPIGHMQKEAVRAYARKHNLPSADKPDSQGLCFIGHVDMKDFLSHYIQGEPGAVLNENGEVIGGHNGVAFVTLGERLSFKHTAPDTHRTPLYVVAKDMTSNTITVSSNQHAPHTAHRTIQLCECTLPAEIPHTTPLVCEIRYHGERIPCTATGHVITFASPQLVAPGQSVVIYDGERCVGGGVATA